MKVDGLMHVAFFTRQLDALVDFYVNKLGFTYAYDVTFEIYADRPDRPAQYKMAQENPKAIFNVYIEISDKQFIELFPIHDGLDVDVVQPEPGTAGYHHFAIAVQDIYEARETLEKAGVVFDTEIAKGPSETYQMWTHDPDGNKLEIMQFTAKSKQLKENR